MNHTNTVSRKSLTLRKNFLWSLAGYFFYGGTQWAILIIIAKLGTPEMLGRFSLSLAVTAPVIMFANLNLRSVIATDYLRKYDFSNYSQLRILALTVAFSIIWVIVFIGKFDSNMVLLIMIIASAKIIESMSDLRYGFIQRLERMDIIAQSLSLKGIVSIIFLLIGLIMTNSLIFGALGLTISWLMVYLFFDLPRYRLMQNDIFASKSKSELGRSKRTFVTVRSLLWMSLPLGIATFLSSLNTNLPRYLIQNYLGERELGYFTALSYITIIGARFVFSLGESVCPRLAKLYSLGKKYEFRKLAYQVCMLLLALSILGVALLSVFGIGILSFIYKPEYGEREDIFILLMIAGLFYYMAIILQYIMTAMRQFRAQPIILFLVSIISFIAFLYFIPLYGLMGAAIAMCVSSIVHMLFNILVDVVLFKRWKYAHAEL